MAKKKTIMKPDQDLKLKQDIASFKAMFAFILFCLVIFFTASNMVYERGSLYMKINFFVVKCPWVIGAFVLLFGLACLWKYLNSRKKKDESFRYFSSNDACGVTLFLLTYFLMLIVTTHTYMIIAATIGFAVAYYVRHFYLKDFYLITLFNIVAAFMIWMVKGNPGTSGTVSVIAKVGLALICLGTLIYVVITAVRLLSDKAFMKKEKLTLIPIVISVAVAAVTAVLCCTGAVNVLVGELVLLIQYVGLGVFYTVRLLNQ
ncbi:MAG: hypothetical protein E7583_06220 [Ruminococcaceae bacterium]|nr:hypothetical protein [Oscillospiraceae bacterium]